MFWARCEYEFLMASWPFGSYNFREEMKKFLKNPINLDDYTQCFNFENIIIADMHKIDIHEQIMMNIDIIVDKESYDVYLEAVKEYTALKEGSMRCYNCYEFRIKRNSISHLLLSHVHRRPKKL